MFIEEYPAAVAPELCSEIVAMFEADSRRQPSVTMIDGDIRPNKRRTGTMIQNPFKGSEAWGQVFEKLQPAFRSTIKQFAAKHGSLAHLAQAERLSMSTVNIERVDPGQGFDWHSDQSSATRERVLGALLYLNTITEGGGTEFAYQQQVIQPQAGKIALFPPFWTHLHRGISPISGPKYVLSYYWIYQVS